MWQISDFLIEVQKSQNLLTIARNMLPSMMAEHQNVSICQPE